MVGLSNEDARLMIRLEDQKAEKINAFKQQCEQDNMALGKTPNEILADQMATVKKHSTAIHTILDLQLHCLDTAQAGSAISRMTIVEHNLETNTSPPETGSGEKIQYSEVVKSHIALLKDLAGKQKHSSLISIQAQELLLEQLERQVSDNKKIKDLIQRRIAREKGVTDYSLQACAKFRTIGPLLEKLNHEITTSTFQVETKMKLLEVERGLTEQYASHVKAIEKLVEGTNSSVLKDLLASLLAISL